MNRPIILITLLTGLIWLRSSWDKISGGKFIDSLAPTLTKFSSNNPYPWYKETLLSFAIPNAKSIAPLIMWGEFLVALSLTLVSLALLFNLGNKKILGMVGVVGCLGGMMLNGLFWLAAAWTSPSTDSINLFMLGIQTILLGYFFRLSMVKK